MTKARHKTSDLGEGGGRDVQEGADICVPMADICCCWEKPTQYYKAIILSLKINKYKKN